MQSVRAFGKQGVQVSDLPAGGDDHIVNRVSLIISHTPIPDFLCAVAKFLDDL